MGYGLVFLAPAHADFLTGIPQDDSRTGVNTP